MSFFLFFINIKVFLYAGGKRKSICKDNEIVIAPFSTFLSCSLMDFHSAEISAILWPIFSFFVPFNFSAANICQGEVGLKGTLARTGQKWVSVCVWKYNSNITAGKLCRVQVFAGANITCLNGQVTKLLKKWHCVYQKERKRTRKKKFIDAGMGTDRPR